MSEPFLPYGRQSVDEDDIARVVAVLRGDFLTTGPTVDAFEQGVGERCGGAGVAAVSSGTAALHAAYFAAGLGEDDEIVTSPLTFAATANAALYLGATVRFVDVEPDTGLIDAAQVEAALGPKTKLLVPVDYAGLPADYDALIPMAHARGVQVVADAAHSFGGRYRGKPVGLLADATALSFHPVKPVTTAEGGAVVSADAALVERARVFRTHGIVKSAETEAVGPWFYEMQHLGMNYRLTDVQCALGLSQLGKLEGFLARREAISRRYDQAFADLPLTLPARREGRQSGWHLYVIRVQDPARRKPLFERLRALGLGVQVHYVPVHLHPYYRRLGYAPGSFPVAEDFYARAISLPLFPAMTDADVDSAIARVRQAVTEVC